MKMTCEEQPISTARHMISSNLRVIEEIYGFVEKLKDTRSFRKQHSQVDVEFVQTLIFYSLESVEMN